MYVKWVMYISIITLGAVAFIKLHHIYNGSLRQKINDRIDTLNAILHYIEYGFKYDKHLRLIGNNFSKEKQQDSNKDTLFEQANVIKKKHKDFLVAHVKIVRKIYEQSLLKLHIAAVTFAIITSWFCSALLACVYDSSNSIFVIFAIVLCVFSSIIGGYIYYEFKKMINDSRYEIILHIAEVDFGFNNGKIKYFSNPIIHY